MTVDKPRKRLENVEEIVRLSELYLDGTVQLALASDARAISLTGVLATYSAALIATGFTLLFYQAHLLRINLTFGFAALGAGMCLLGGVWYATYAAIPRKFNVGGNYIDSWYPEELCGDLVEPLIGQAEVYQNEIKENQLTLKAGATYLRRALLCVIASPLAAIFFGVVAYLVFPHLAPHLVDPGQGGGLDSVG